MRTPDEKNIVRASELKRLVSAVQNLLNSRKTGPDQLVNFNLAYPFYEQTRARPDQEALHVEGRTYSYGDLADLVARAAAALGPADRIAVLAGRTLGAYIGVLGTAWCGAAYIPLSPKMPIDRIKYVLETTRPDALVVDSEGRACLTPDVRAIAPPRILEISDYPDALPKVHVDAPAHREANDLAYIIFTSGTTGTPKGVMIQLGSVSQYLKVTNPRYNPGPADRTALTSEISFDFSVLEMFSPWSAGAAVYVVPPGQMMGPARFIKEHQLTVWFSVPSIAAFMRRMKMLKPAEFPSLRYSVFGGEALPYALAEAWRIAAPASVVENHYGPAEATVFCICATVGPEFPPTPVRDIVPSGVPLPGIEAAILNEQLEFLQRGNEGQLAVSGRQLAVGYFNEPELTRARFPRIGGKIWYLTGDLARQDERGTFHHLGRIDHQIKVLGQRVELEEIESHLRKLANSDQVAAVAWPVRDGMVEGITAFTSGVTASPQELLQGLRQALPNYMVPRIILQIEAMPLGATGKIDRKALARYLDHMAAGNGDK